MSSPNNQNVPPTPDHVPDEGESTVPEIEIDQTEAPRPEEEIADILRAEPDTDRA